MNKHKNISKLDQLIKEFEFLSRHGVSDGEQFQALSDAFKEQYQATLNTLDNLDNKISDLTKLSSALLAYEEGYETVLPLLESHHLKPQIGLQGQIEKQLLEASVERQVLQDKMDSIASDYKMYEKVKDHRQEEDKKTEEELTK